MRTAFNPIVRESGDLSAGLFDLKGRMIAQAVTGTPGHVNTMANSVRYFLEQYPLEDMHPEDIYLTNDPWKAAGHLNDFMLVRPLLSPRCLDRIYLLHQPPCRSWRAWVWA